MESDVDIFAESDRFDLKDFLDFTKRNMDFHELLKEWLEYYRTMRFDLNDFIDFAAMMNMDFYETLMDWLDAYERELKKKEVTK